MLSPFFVYVKFFVEIYSDAMTAPAMRFFLPAAQQCAVVLHRDLRAVGGAHICQVFSNLRIAAAAGQADLRLIALQHQFNGLQGLSPITVISLLFPQFSGKITFKALSIYTPCAPTFSNHCLQ